MLRTRETAELAFGRDRVRVTWDLLNEAFPGTDDEHLARRLRRLLATRPPPGQNAQQGRPDRGSAGRELQPRPMGKPAIG